MPETTVCDGGLVAGWAWHQNEGSDRERRRDAVVGSEMLCILLLFICFVQT